MFGACFCFPLLLHANNNKNLWLHIFSPTSHIFNKQLKISKWAKKSISSKGSWPKKKWIRNSLAPFWNGSSKNDLPYYYCQVVIIYMHSSMIVPAAQSATRAKKRLFFPYSSLLVSPRNEMSTLLFFCLVALVRTIRFRCRVIENCWIFNFLYFRCAAIPCRCFFSISYLTPSWRDT